MASKQRTSLLFGGTILCIIILSSFALHLSFVWYPTTLDNPEVAIVTAEPATRPSRLVGGVPGYFVLDNIWFKGDTFYHNNLNLNLDGDRVVSGPTKFEYGNMSEVDTHLEGTSLLVNEAGHHYMWHYYHFISEDILGALASLAGSPDGSKRQAFPERLIIPWESGWDDNWHLNPLVVKGLFSENVINTNQWKSMIADDQTVFFSRVIVVDRWASHRHNHLAEVWNKMALQTFDMPKPPHFFEPIRQRLLDNLEIRPKDRSTPKVVYVDRQGSSRKLREQDHQGLVELGRELHDKGIIIWEHVQWENMSGESQFRVVSDAMVMIGVHGQGLSHQLWMPEDSTLIELFPSNSFIRDYQAVAGVLKHSYYAVINDTILSQDDWIHNDGQLGAERLHDGTEIALHVPFVKHLLEVILAA